MKPLTHDRRILLLAVLAVLPAAATALGILWINDYTPKVRWTLTFVIVAAAGSTARTASSRIRRS